MENFGDRLSVDDIWRVVLFLKTIPNGTLSRTSIPTPKDYIVWQPSKELLAWLKSRQKLTNNAVLLEGADQRPVHRRRRCACSRASRPATRFVINDGKTRAVAPGCGSGIKAIYSQLLEPARGPTRGHGARSCRRSRRS